MRTRRLSNNLPTLFYTYSRVIHYLFVLFVFNYVIQTYRSKIKHKCQKIDMI